MMKSVHQRWFPASPSVIAPLLARVWTGTADDLFPVDWIPTRRDNPPGVPADALVPGVTRVSHGFMPFLFERADAAAWRVRTPFGGWHGFDLVAEGGGTRLTHTLAIDAAPTPIRLLWQSFIEAGHDWALEALFDRLALVLDSADGRVTFPPTPAPPARVRLAIALWNRVPGAAQDRIRRTFEARIA